MNTRQRPAILIWIIFIVSSGTVIITLVSAIFPALILGLMNNVKYPMTIDVFELGISAYSVLITNSILGVVVIFHITKKLPRIFANTIKRILGFEVSSKVALIAIIIILGIYIAFTLGEIFQGESWEDYTRIVKPKLESWSVDEFFHITGNPLSYFLLTTSMNVFGNYKVIPLISSIALLVAVYFTTSIMSGKRLAGLVSMTVILSSTIFLTYDTSITYPSFWILFYLLSLLTIHKGWPLSPFFFILAILSKPMPIFLLPMTLFYIYSSDISQKKKITIMASYGIIIAALLVKYFADSSLQISFNPHEFWSGFTAVSSQFRFDGFVLIFVLPLVVGLFALAKKGIKDAQSVMVLISGMLLLAPVISGFTTYTNNPYRFVPLVIFFAMGVGILFSRRVSQESAIRSSVL